VRRPGPRRPRRNGFERGWAEVMAEGGAKAANNRRMGGRMTFRCDAAYIRPLCDEGGAEGRAGGCNRSRKPPLRPIVSKATFETLESRRPV